MPSKPQEPIALTVACNLKCMDVPSMLLLHVCWPDTVGVVAAASEGCAGEGSQTTGSRGETARLATVLGYSA